MTIIRKWFIIKNEEVLLPNKQNVYFDDYSIANIRPYFLRHFDLGIIDNTQYLAVEIDDSFYLKGNFELTSLRKALSLISSEQYSMVVKAYSVIRSDKNHQFCGRCGEYTVTREKQFERFCRSCDVSFFPRISPSIIVLIHRDDQLIMARSPHFAEGVYGLIAGFVETGETLEEAVHREIQEEIGIKVKNIVYFGSQPWPFPDSLMLAFTAEHASGEIVIDNKEIEEAGWYRYDNLPGRPSMAISIASKLLDNFVNICKKKYDSF